MPFTSELCPSPPKSIFYGYLVIGLSGKDLQPKGLFPKLRALALPSYLTYLALDIRTIHIGIQPRSQKQADQKDFGRVSGSAAEWLVDDG